MHWLLKTIVYLIFQAALLTRDARMTTLQTERDAALAQLATAQRTLASLQHAGMILD
jgi:hypothetical protein